MKSLPAKVPTTHRQAFGPVRGGLKVEGTFQRLHALGQGLQGDFSHQSASASDEHLSFFVLLTLTVGTPDRIG
jgi:hypothetical protein